MMADFNLIIKNFKVIIISIIIFIIITSSCTSYSDVVYSGMVNVYHVKSQGGENFEGPDYKFYWVASDGSYDSCTESVFRWTPPAVSETRNVTIAAYVANSIDESICVGKDEIHLMVQPRQEGTLRLEKTLLSRDDEIKIDDILTYRIRITNTGRSRIVSLPLLDDYPEKFLRVESSDLPWDEDTGSVLAWNNLLNSPLDMGKSVEIKVSFRAMAATSSMVSNIVRVFGARIENGDMLEPVSAESIIHGIRDQCQLLGPSTGCIGSSVIFSSPSWSWGDKWMAVNASTNEPVGGFNDVTQSEVSWTPVAIGDFIISYNSNCRHKIRISQCSDPKGDLELKKELLGDKHNINIDDKIDYRITITNTGQTNITVLPLVDAYPEQFLKPLNADPRWDGENQSALNWDNLLRTPLQPGNSTTVSLSFKAIAPTDLVVVNLAEVRNAEDDKKNLLQTKTASEKFYGINSNCSIIGPESGYTGVPVTFSAPSGMDVDKWIAQDSEGRSVEGFNDTRLPVVIWTPPYSGTFEISYNSQCKHYISIKDGALYISKKSAKDVYSPQDTVKYTIDFGNHLDFEANDVTVYDVLPEVEYINSTPEPDYIKGNTLIWKKGTMKPGTNGSIDLFVRIKETSNIVFKESQSVYGEGYAYSNKRLSTTTPPVSLRNYANITAFHGKEFNSSTSAILVQDSRGTEVRSTEHGSGTYWKEIESRLSSMNKTIQIEANLMESFGISTFSLPQRRSINYSSRWSELQMAKNRETGAFFKQQIMYATMIQSNSTIALDKNGSVMKSEISFEGAGHFREQKMPSNNSSRCNEPAIYDSSEDYLGRFEVDKKFDEYGKNVVLVHSASGNGFISSSRSVGNTQKSYHSGTGAYQVKEQIQTQTSYMDKSINARYESLNYSYAPGFNTNISKKWTEGMRSRSGESSPKGLASSEPVSYIAEEYSNADFLNKSTVASGLKEMKTEADFSGIARFEAFSSQPSTNGSESSISLYEEHSGIYKISRNLKTEEAARFDEPHINATISGKLAPTEGNLIDYIITVTNDGTRALGPVIITDYFPPGTEYVYSSLRPSELNRSFARWTLLDLGIGASPTIELKLNMTGEHADTLVNRVKVRGGHSDQWIEAEALSALQLDWLGCCSPHLSAAKTAQADSIDPMLVHYSIALKNRNNQIMTANIRDLLPKGMVFQSSSPAPADHSTNEVFWTITDLLPEETRCINYTVRAMRSGIFVNQAHIESYSADGSDYALADVASRIEIQDSRGQKNGSAWQTASCFGLSSIEQNYTEEWIPCGVCVNAEAEPAAWACSSCTTSSSGELD